MNVQCTDNGRTSKSKKRSGWSEPQSSRGPATRRTFLQAPQLSRQLCEGPWLRAQIGPLDPRPTDDVLQRLLSPAIHGVCRSPSRAAAPLARSPGACSTACSKRTISISMPSAAPARAPSTPFCSPQAWRKAGRMRPAPALSASGERRRRPPANLLPASGARARHREPAVAVSV